MTASRHPASYRDPSGYVFRHAGTLYRQVNQCFKEEYETLMQSGLYQHLVDKNLLVAHDELIQNLSGDGNFYKTLLPQKIPFISYCYEWSFDMLKDAALLTLQLAKEAMNFGMMLKDATPFNIQFYKGKPIFIDSLSFEPYDETKPWIAYQQFCESFFAPLALMHYLQYPLQPLLLSYPEGIPLLLAARMLPWKSKLHLHVHLHIHLQAKYAAKNGAAPKEKQAAFSRQKLSNILASLENSIRSFRMNVPTGAWSGYYEEARQRTDYVSEKKAIIEQWIARLPEIKTAIDVGANEGEFSHLLAQKNISTISADSDHYSVNNLYKKIKTDDIPNIHPLVMDFSNPSPSIGVNNKERSSFAGRINTDLVLALAVLHHLAIGKNIPFAAIAEMLQGLGRFLIVEFVPKEDEKVQLMLQQKKDIYDWYTEENFIVAFSRNFALQWKEQVSHSKRILFLFKVRS